MRHILLTIAMMLAVCGQAKNVNVTIYANNCDSANVISCPVGQQLRITAEATLAGSKFAKWSDGNTDNPRLITATQDSTFMAEFTKIQPNNEIWYTSTDGLIVEPNTGICEAKIVSNAYANGKGIIKFDREVTKLGETAFQNCNRLLTISIPSSTKTIGYQAFQMCTSLVSINIPNSVTQIDFAAFNCCTDLTSIIIPDSVRSIPLRCFGTCKKLASVTIGHGVINIEKYAFTNCTTLTSVTIPDNVKSIALYAFEGCTSLSSVIIGDGVNSIGKYAFTQCDNLASLHIGKGVSSIGEHAFSSQTLSSIIVDSANTYYNSRNNCNAIIETKTKTLVLGCQNTIIPNDVRSIGEQAFHSCSKLLSITFSDSLTHIGNQAFAGCSSLKTLTIPNRVTYIDYWAFYNCTGLTSVIIGSSVDSMGYNVFNTCSSLASITCLSVAPPILQNDVFYKVDKSISVYVPAESVEAYKAAEGWKEFTNIQVIPQPNNVITYTATNKLPEVTETYASGLHTNVFNATIVSHKFADGQGTITFADDVTSIGAWAFHCYDTLTSIDIPRSVEFIGERVFTGCSYLTVINVDSNNKHYESLDGVLFSYGKDTLIQFPLGKRIEEYSIPERVKVIGDWAFCNAMAIKRINLCSTIQSIGFRTFQFCYVLDSIVLPEGIISIGELAFNGCTSISKISLPESVQCIGENAFMSCSSLKTIQLPSKLKRIEEETFYSCTSLEQLVLFDSINFIGHSAFFANSGLKSITAYSEVPPTVEDEWCFNMVSKTIPVYVPAESIEAYKSAEGWKEFTNILPIECIIDSGKCGDNLTWKLSCDSVLTISGTGAMYDFNNSFCNQCAPWHDCYSVIDSTIKEVIVEPGVTTIGNQAFYLCVNLQSISLPDGLLHIGGSAFASSGIKSIQLPASLESIGYDAFAWCDKMGDITIPDKVTFLGQNTFAHCQSMTQCHLGAGLETIDFATFQGCIGLTSMMIPKNVTSIGGSAFIMNTSLAYFEVEEGNSSYWAVDGVLFSKDTTTLVAYPEGKEGTTYTMPSAVRDIQYGAFSDNGKLTEVIFSENLVTIGDYAFSGCRELLIANLPDKVTKIGQWAYANCMKIDSVRLGSSITEIGDCALMNMAVCRIIDCYIPTPISVGTQALDYVPQSCLLVVNPGTDSLWRSAQDWNTLTIVERQVAPIFDPDHPLNPGVYQVDATASPTEGGTIEGAGEHEEGTTVQLTAVANKNYAFVNWSDGETSATRSFIMTANDTAFTANFILVAKDTVIVTDEQNISNLLVGNITHMIVTETGKLVVDEPTEALSLTLYQTNTASAQVVNVSNLTVATADMVLRLEPTAEQATLAKWYAFGVPFEVEVASGIAKEGASSNAQSGYDFVIDNYDGALRATTQQGWKRCQASDVLQQGKFYMIAVNGTQNLWRFTKKASAAITEQTSLTVNQNSATSANHSGWNGLSNSLLQSAMASMQGLTYATVYRNATSTYETILLAQSALDASLPFFVQVAKSGTILLSEATTNAPARMLAATTIDDNPIHTIAFQNKDYTDKAYLSLSETKANEYTIGLDVEKMQANTTSQPQLWLEAYGMQLAAHEARVEENAITTIPVGLYAPADGEFTLTTTTTTTTTFALLNNGSEVEPTALDEEANTAIWTLYLAKGTNLDYALQIGERGIGTGVQNAEGRMQNVEKVIIEGTLYIKRDGKTYTAQGGEVK